MTDTSFPSQIKTAAQNAEARKLRILNERLWHFTSVGLGNCRAAQRVRREIECQIALLANANFNPNEPRDKDGRWTQGGDTAGSASNKPNQHITKPAIEAPASGPGAKMTNEPGKYITNLSSSFGATINNAPIEFSLGFEEGLQRAASSMGEGLAQFSDPGPLPDNFNTFMRAQDAALKMIPNLQVDPITGEVTGGNTYGRALNQLDQQREAQREQMRAPGEAFSQAAGELADQLGALKDALPGPKIVGTAGVTAGQVAGYMAPAAIPGIGPITGAVSAGLGSTGDTFDRAFEIYKLAGYPEANAREMARDVALRNGDLTALIFALPVGRLAALPESALGRILAAAGISGTQLSADKVQTLLHAKATYNPNLTFGDIAREAGLTFLYGAGFGAATHGAGEASRVGAATARVPAADPQEPLSHLENSDHTFQMSYGPDDDETRAQVNGLQDWAKDTGRLTKFNPSAGSTNLGGAEHDVFKDPATGRVDKVTAPGGFGYIMTQHGLEPANPSFYLQRIGLMNQVFNSDIRMEGVTPGKNASIITSQPFHEADPKLNAQGLSEHPPYNEVKDFMNANGFKPMSGSDGWIRDADGVMAFDVKPENFVKTEKGVVPVDLILQKGPLLP